MCFTGDMHVMGVFLSFMIGILVNSLLSKCLSSIILHTGMHTGSGASREVFPNLTSGQWQCSVLPWLHLQIYHCLLWRLTFFSPSPQT